MVLRNDRVAETGAFNLEYRTGRAFIHRFKTVKRDCLKFESLYFAAKDMNRRGGPGEEEFMRFDTAELNGRARLSEIQPHRSVRYYLIRFRNRRVN